MGLQLLLIVVGAILAAAIRVEKAVLWWLAQPNRHIERAARQILLHSVAAGPAHHTAAVQVEDSGEVKPAVLCPDIGGMSYGFAFVQLRFRQPTSG